MSGMRMEFGLRPELAQKQIIAPRMIQSMEILQLPVMALQEKIQQELQEAMNLAPTLGVIFLKLVAIVHGT